MCFSRFNYYTTSALTLFWGIRNWRNTIIGIVTRRPFIICLQNNLRFKVRSFMDVWIIKETCLDRDYEVYGTQVQDGWTIIDIGASLGGFAIYAARHLPHSKILAFEPYPESFHLLCENIHINRVKNILPFPYAVSSTGEHLFLNTRTGIPVRHSTTPASNNSALQVPGITLHTILKQTGQCDLLKIDCEGAEYDILLNARKADLEKILRISMEYHDGVTKFSHLDLITCLTQQHGYCVKLSPNPAHAHLGFLYAYRPEKQKANAG